MRQKEEEKFTHDIVLTVNRDTVYTDLLNHYKRRTTLLGKVKIEFENEDAVGDGVSKDGYSEFFESFYKKMDGYVEKIPIHIDEEELELIGKIVTHAFFCYNIFPQQLSKCALVYNIFGSIDDGSLIKSFLRFLTPKEAALFHDLPRVANSEPLIQPIMDVLFDFNIFSRPSKENLNDVLAKAGKTALVKNPLFSMKSIIKGMGPFWNKLSKEMFYSLFTSTELTAQKLIDSFTCIEQSNQESKVITWLHRFVRCCETNQLFKILRFITGASVYVPEMNIKVEFIDQAYFPLSPRAHTCFKILILPRQYRSFTELEDNLNNTIFHSRLSMVLQDWVI